MEKSNWSWETEKSNWNWETATKEDILKHVYAECDKIVEAGYYLVLFMQQMLQSGWKIDDDGYEQVDGFEDVALPEAVSMVIEAFEGVERGEWAGRPQYGLEEGEEAA